MDKLIITTVLMVTFLMAFFIATSLYSYTVGYRTTFDEAFVTY